MEKNRKYGVLLLSGLLVATFAAKAAHSLDLGRTHSPKPSKPHNALWNPPYKPAATPKVAGPVALGTLRLDAELDRTAVLQHGDNQIHVGVTLDTRGLSTGKRVPSDFVVVFDRSGSMDGQKIQYGKQALRELIARLADEDRLALIAYDTTAELRVPLGRFAKDARSSWLREVDALSVAGGTNMSAGLDLGIEELRRSRTTGRATRVLLLSDGLANQGDASLGGLSARASEVMRSESVLSTIGIGSDFDENVMTSLARAGTGAFYYLAKLETLPTLLNAELKTASETYAQMAELRVKLRPGVRLLSAAGRPFKQDADTAVVPVGSVYGDYKQTLWLTLQVPNTQLTTTEIGEVSVRYLRDDKPYEVFAAALPKVACVKDDVDFRKQINQPVWERATLDEELGRSQEELSKAISSGTEADIDRAVASAEQQRKLASELKNARVLSQLDAFRAQAAPAKAAQASGGEARSQAAKRSTAASFGSRSKDSYKNIDYAFSY